MRVARSAQMHLASPVLLALVLSCSLTPVAGAQVNPGTEAGVPAYGSFEGSHFDQINLLNGNLHLEIPVLTVKERGRTFIWHFYFEPIVWNLIWHSLPKPPPPAPDPSYYAVTRTGLSGTLIFSNNFQWGGATGSLSGVLTCPGTNQPYQVYTGFSMGGPDGTIHPFPLRQEVGQYPCYGSTLSGPATDGSGITYNITTQLGTLPDGTQFTAGALEDANGNQASSTTDMLNRVPVTTTQGPNFTFTSPLGAQLTAPQYTLYNITDTNGQQQVYRLDYQLIDVSSNMCPIVQFTKKTCNEDTGDDLLMPQKLTLPNGKTYLFTFNNNTPGQLARVDLPTGAYITYTYANSYFAQPPASNPQNWAGRQGVVSRTVHENGNTYTWNYSGIPNGTVTVTDPDGNVQVHTYQAITDNAGHSSATKYEQSVVYENSSGQVLRTVANTYAGDLDPNSLLLVDGRITSVTTTLDNGLVSQKQTDYETFQYNCADSSYCPGTATRMNPRKSANTIMALVRPEPCFAAPTTPTSTTTPPTARPTRTSIS